MFWYAVLSSVCADRRAQMAFGKLTLNSFKMNFLLLGLTLQLHKFDWLTYLHTSELVFTHTGPSHNLCSIFDSMCLSEHVHTIANLFTFIHKEATESELLCCSILDSMTSALDSSHLGFSNSFLN